MTNLIDPMEHQFLARAPVVLCWWASTSQGDESCDSTSLLADLAMLLQSHRHCTPLVPTGCTCQRVLLRTRWGKQLAHVQQLAQRAVWPGQRCSRCHFCGAPRCRSGLIGGSRLHCRGPRCKRQIVCCQPAAAAAGDDDQTRRQGIAVVVLVIFLDECSPHLVC